MSNFENIMIASTVYVDGVGKLGNCEKIMVPKLKKKTEKFRSGGMLMEREVALGYEMMEIEFDLHNYDPQVAVQIGLFSRKNVPISVRGAFDGDTTQNALLMQCAGEFKEIDPGTFEPGKKAIMKCKAMLTSMKQTFGGNVLMDIDLLNNVYFVNGVDEYAWIRTALGV